MITALLTMFFRWLFDCPPMIDNDRELTAAMCSILTPLEVILVIVLSSGLAELDQRSGRKKGER